jgi:hypothetical protein
MSFDPFNDTAFFEAPHDTETVHQDPTDGVPTPAPPNPFPGVDFSTSHTIPRLISHRSPLDQFHVLLAFATPALRDHLIASNQARHDIIELQQRHDLMAAEVLRLRAMVPNPDLDILPASLGDTETVPLLPEPGFPEIDPTHPQLLELLHELQTAQATASDATTQNAEHLTLITQLRNALQLAQEAIDIRPTDSASNIPTELLTNQTVTQLDLVRVAYASALTMNQLHRSPHSPIHYTKNPTADTLLEYFANVASYRLNPSNSTLDGYSQNIQISALTHTQITEQMSPRLTALSPDEIVTSLVNAHTRVEQKAISKMTHTECSFSQSCIIRALNTAEDAYFSFPVPGYATLFATDFARDSINGRRFLFTVLRLLALVPDHGTSTEIINAVTRNL